MFKRIAPLQKCPEGSFFLWGPRKTGKSFLIRDLYTHVPRIDLLDTDLFAKYSIRPAVLREECLARKNQDRFIIIDEIQKVSALLDEVHFLIENHGFIFGLCGSSARKLKRGHANLLGGRAVRYELRGLVYPELGKEFDLIKILNQGYLPSHYLSKNFRKLAQSYINEYLKEEIAAEGLVRNLPLFSNFLRAAAFSDSEIANYTNIASDCGVSSPTVREYFEILVDTLIGSFLPAYTKREKRKVIHAPKFYFFDVMIPNYLSKRGVIAPGSEIIGKAFENWVFHELKSYIIYCEKEAELSYWRLADSGKEVDFMINDFEVAIEAKAAENVRSDYLKGLRELKKEHPNTKKCIVVSLEKVRRLTSDHILILPYMEFVQSLWQGEFF
ncbi:MAG: ATP-binding protein [Bdellovibrio sp.]|nr:ATP-binding protein [Bdellovibrio sp.]